MDFSFFDLPVESVGAQETPAVTALHAQRDGSLLCGLSFCRPLLFRLRPDATATKLDAIENLKLEDVIGFSAVAITNGLRATTSGDTAFAVLHEGMVPGFIKGLFGGKIIAKAGEDLLAFFRDNDGGMGFKARQSVIQISEKELVVRRAREPGILLDVAHIGDFLFGLTEYTIWREPYLNSEKRETLRKDLSGNEALHRDDDGTFWLASRNLRLLRLGHNELKPKPTPLKLAGEIFSVSATSTLDGWLYGVAAEGKSLFRVRRNPVSFEEEFQALKTFGTRVSGLAVVENETEGRLIIALEGEPASLWQITLERAEDPETPPAARAPERLLGLPGISSVSSLTADLTHCEVNGGIIWAGEGRMGSGQLGFRRPRIVRISL